MRENAFNWFQFFRFCYRHLHALGAYLFAIMRCPMISILGRDFAYHAMLAHLNHEALIECIVITNTNYSAQPLWMTDLPCRRFLTHMVWYSQNTIPLVYADDPIGSELPNYRHMRVDVSWVWTVQYSAYLRSLEVPGKINVVGPILWQLPPAADIGRARKNDLVIVVFDVTPVTDERAGKIGLFRNYYNAVNMSGFLRGVVRVKEMLEQDAGKRVRVLLKHKRGFNSGHDHRYIHFVEELEVKGKVELISFNANIYELISQADIVVVAPYSSPAYIADHLAIPSIFFDSSGELLPTYEKGQDINFASGDDGLMLLANAIISVQ
jgi:polysaccharide biosynthesis PFTS motif protein